MGTRSGRRGHILVRLGSVGIAAAALTLGVVGLLPSLAPHDRDQGGPFWPCVALSLVAVMALSHRLRWLTKVLAFGLAGYSMWLPSSIYNGESPDFVPFFAILPWLAGVAGIRARLVSAYWWLLMSCGFLLYYLSLAEAQDHGIYLLGLRHMGVVLAECGTATLIAGMALLGAAQLGQVVGRTATSEPITAAKR